ncbi:MAG: hypothetical protein LBJ01_07355 [Tannerella sp.]|nr:hypothetical protein [Tannerella sp.]
MKRTLFFFCLVISSMAAAQDSVRVAGGGSMSGFPSVASGNGEPVAYFSFKPDSGDVRLEIALWEALPGADTLTETVLLDEKLMKAKRSRVDLLVDTNGTQVDIKCIIDAGKVIIGRPVKPVNARILPFLFHTNPRVVGTGVPVALLVDSDRDFEEKDFVELLAVQDIRQIRTTMLRDLKNRIGDGGIKILTCHLKKLP